MATEWYYTINGQQAPAPVSAAQLKQLATNNQLQPTDLVWQEGMATWMPASSVKGLFGGARSGTDQPALIETASGPAKARKPGAKKSPGDKEEAAPADEGLLGLHPLLVWLLSIVTLGIFGLIYVYLTCSAFARPARRREADGAGKPLGRPRHPIGVLILSYLTLGIYFLFWLHRALRECGAYTGRADVAPRNELALMLIFPPYAVYVATFRLPELIRAAQQQAKVTESPALGHAYFFLSPFLFPALPFLGMIEQEALNRVWLEAP
jgi:hypothetical protein